MYYQVMRTTITLDDATYEIASLYAAARGITLGGAIGELIQRSQAASRPSRLKRAKNGLPVMTSRRKTVTPGLVKKLEAEDIG